MIEFCSFSIFMKNVIPANILHSYIKIEFFCGRVPINCNNSFFNGLLKLKTSFISVKKNDGYVLFSSCRCLYQCLEEDMP